jgi:hypothetical protein
VPNRNGISLVEVCSEFEIFMDRISKVALAHFTVKFREVIHDQPVLVGEEFRSHLGNLPARDISMKAIKESRIDHDIGKGRQEVTGLHHGIHRLVDVTDKHH